MFPRDHSGLARTREDSRRERANNKKHDKMEGWKKTIKTSRWNEKEEKKRAEGKEKEENYYGAPMNQYHLQRAD